jgi:hypothetical protein
VSCCKEEGVGEGVTKRHAVDSVPQIPLEVKDQ